MLKIFTLSGKAEHGKDFFAKILQEKLEQSSKKVAILHYADWLKTVCKIYFGWNGIKDDTGRSILQKVGTDLARKNYPNVWVDTIILLIKAVFINYDYILIPDTRFEGEVNRLKEEGFDTTSLKVVRLNYENSLSPEQRLHPSETALDNFHFDYILESESGRENVEGTINTFLEYIELN
jgi:hypothetical protein